MKKVRRSLRIERKPRLRFVLASCAPLGFFDITAVRHLTYQVERYRHLLQVAALNYAELDYEIYAETDELHTAYAEAQREYAVACVALVNALHDYWPECFGHDVPF